ncbi:hypothetical protein IFM89_025138, partial [Coptis chinensis]
ISEDNVCGSGFYLRMAQLSVGLANWHRLRKVEQKSLKREKRANGKGKMLPSKSGVKCS